MMNGEAVLLPAYQKVTPALLAQIRGEFLEMPGLTLTLRQAMPAVAPRSR